MTQNKFIIMKNILFYTLPLFFVFFGCTKESRVQTEIINSDWSFRKAGETEWLPAIVPGCAHTDLLENEPIPDPSFRKDELEVQWIENSDSEYEITLSTKKPSKNLAFFTSNSDGFFTDNFIDLIPGKSYKISFLGNRKNLESELKMVFK